MDRFFRSIADVFAKLGFGKGGAVHTTTLRERHQALIDSQRRYTPAERRVILDREAALALDDSDSAALAEGDEAFADYLKDQKTVELRRATGAESQPTA